VAVWSVMELSQKGNAEMGQNCPFVTSDVLYKTASSVAFSCYEK
jgi:hypothetical protein